MGGFSGMIQLRRGGTHFFGILRAPSFKFTGLLSLGRTHKLSYEVSHVRRILYHSGPHNSPGGDVHILMYIIMYV